MKKCYVGLDVLRGIGVFMVIWLHSAFYYFGGLHDINFDNPPTTVTVIGLLFMFAGLFAMISGAGHGVQYYRKTEKHYSSRKLMKYTLANCFAMFVIAKLYFIFTGPGLVTIGSWTMNNSILVELIRNGKLIGTNAERLLYVSSLSMIAMNILVVGVFFMIFRNMSGKVNGLLILSIFMLVVSLLRIPLYELYLELYYEKAFFRVALLNIWVNKANPLFPYMAFGIMGLWLSTLLCEKTWKTIVRHVVPVASVLFICGAIAYVRLPDTMLKRNIDPKWFAIMMAQMGLFLFMILVVLKVYDYGKEPSTMNVISRFFCRFGVAALTPFFFESTISAGVFRAIQLLVPSLSFSMWQAIGYGFLIALFIGVLMIFWEKVSYRFGLEYFLVRWLSLFGESEKDGKLKGYDKHSKEAFN